MPATTTSAPSSGFPASPPQGLSPARFISFMFCHLRNFQDEEAAQQQPHKEHREYDGVPAWQAKNFGSVVEFEQKAADKSCDDAGSRAGDVAEAHEEAGLAGRNHVLHEGPVHREEESV